MYRIDLLAFYICSEKLDFKQMNLKQNVNLFSCDSQQLYLTLTFTKTLFLISFNLWQHHHCVKSVRIRSISPYSIRIQECTGQKNLEDGYFLRSAYQFKNFSRHLFFLHLVFYTKILVWKNLFLNNLMTHSLS